MSLNRRKYRQQKSRTDYLLNISSGITCQEKGRIYTSKYISNKHGARACTRYTAVAINILTLKSHTSIFH